MTDRLTMQDPREQHPKPPFPEQPQPAPGLASRLDPPADHGEESYKGDVTATGSRLRPGPLTRRR